MSKKSIISFSLIIALPNIVWAFNFPNLNPGGPVVSIPILISDLIDGIFGVLWPVFSAAAFITFIWAGILFLTARGDPTKAALARQAVIYGSIGVAVGLLAFSIPFIIKFALGI